MVRAADTPAGLLQREREETRALLAHGYAQDWIDQSELEDRLERAEHAASVAELRALTVELRPTEAPGTALATVSAPERIGTLFGAIERAGAWTVARKTEIKAVFGSVLLDLRQAELPDGDLELVVQVTLASLDIIVPPGWQIDNRCGAVLASVEQDPGGAAGGGPRRVLRLSGRVVLGSLAIHERLPGEGARAARKRQRGEQRALAERSRRALGSGEP